MKSIKARRTRGINVGTKIPTCDNSGAKILHVFNVKGYKGRKGRIASAGVGDLIQCSVKSGKPDVRKTVVWAVVVRQRQEYRRPDGLRVKFEDNAAVVLKDDKGSPKGTIFKGPIAKEAAGRWPGVAKVARVIV